MYVYLAEVRRQDVSRGHQQLLPDRHRLAGAREQQVHHRARDDLLQEGSLKGEQPGGVTSGIHSRDPYVSYLVRPHNLGELPQQVREEVHRLDLRRHEVRDRADVVPLRLKRGG